jgi:hypothetical protein
VALGLELRPRRWRFLLWCKQNLVSSLWFARWLVLQRCCGIYSHWEHELCPSSREATTRLSSSWEWLARRRAWCWWGRRRVQVGGSAERAGASGEDSRRCVTTGGAQWVFSIDESMGKIREERRRRACGRRGREEAAERDRRQGKTEEPHPGAGGSRTGGA